MKKINILLLSILCLVLTFSCSKDELKPGTNTNTNTNTGTNTNTNTNTDTNTNTNSGTDTITKDLTYEINDFIWQGLHTWYLWVDDVPNLDVNTFNDSQEELDKFLDDNNNSETFFYSLLYKRGTVDRFSWIVKDYEDLEKSFQGIQKSVGMEYQLFYISGSTIGGYVKYVVNGSPAHDAGIKRGDVFTHVNGIMLNSDNYSSLLNTDATSITFTFSDGDKTLAKVEVEENPIYLVKVLNEGSKKIGYLVYNQFVSDYKTQLNDALGQLAVAGIDELVLDLRYNGGGSVSVATLLSSSIAGAANAGKLMAKSRYNAAINKVITDYLGNDYLNYNFVDKVYGTETPINFLNIDRLFVLVTKNSASASELVINVLKPYMDVFLIGKKTYGKNVGSITLYDSDDFDKDHSTLNKKHKWAMQPIVTIFENSVGFSDYTTGFNVDVEYDEYNDYFDNHNTLIELGERTEPLLAKAIKEITGVEPVAKVKKYVKFKKSYGKLLNIKDDKPFKYEMYFDNLEFTKLPFKLHRKKMLNK